MTSDDNARRENKSRGDTSGEDKSTSDKTEGFEVTRSPEMTISDGNAPQAPNNSEEDQVMTTPPVPEVTTATAGIYFNH